jgi:hypothetical protein
MSFKKPSYYNKKGMFNNPKEQVVQGIICWSLGYPPLDHENNKKITPTQFQRVQTLRAGKGTGAVSKRSDKRAVLKPVAGEAKG